MGDWVALIGFAIAGIISVIVAIFMLWLAITVPNERLSFAAAGILMCFLAIGFFIAVRLFRQEIALNPIRQYLKDPSGFEFIQGEMVSGDYSSGGSKGGRKIIVQIQGKDSSGKELLAIEFFSPSAWPFTTQDAEDSLQEGDDWYDMKGKRRILPVKVHLLHHPKFTTALVGIDKNLLNKT